MLIYVAIFAAIIWFFIVLPQRRIRAAQQKLFSSLSVGDDVVTSGGIHGTVTEVEEGDTVLIEVAEDTEVRVSKVAIARIITDKSAGATADSTEADPPPTPDTTE